MRLSSLVPEDKVRGKPQKTKTTRTLELLSDFAKSSSMVEKIVDIQSTRRGTVALFRTVDGEAYEVEVKPSHMGDFFQKQRGIG